ncbi:hypothetical protein CsSME_00050911 [Camellia sinensis var. sinensis]
MWSKPAGSSFSGFLVTDIVNHLQQVRQGCWTGGLMLVHGTGLLDYCERVRPWEDHLVVTKQKLREGLGLLRRISHSRTMSRDLALVAIGLLCHTKQDSSAVVKVVV